MNQEKLIENITFKLMPALGCKNYKQLADKLGVKAATVRGWVYSGASPNSMTMINMLKAMRSAGRDPMELLED